MVTENTAMDAGIEPERFDVRIKRLKKIPTDSAGLPLIKLKAVEQIAFGEAEFEASRKLGCPTANSSFSVLPSAELCLRILDRTLCIT